MAIKLELNNNILHQSILNIYHLKIIHWILCLICNGFSYLYIYRFIIIEVIYFITLTQKGGRDEFDAAFKLIIYQRWQELCFNNQWISLF